MSVSRIRRQALLIAGLALALIVGLTGPAAAGTGPGSAPYLAETDEAYEQLGFDELATDLGPIKLHCRGTVTDSGPVAGCHWRTESTAISTFQLWRLELRVDDAQRVLVTEVGADTSSATDTGVSAPGAYLYAVLGLDDSGEVVARSRVDRVRFRDPSIEHLRLDCDKVTDEVPATDTAPAIAPSIGCSWSGAEDVDVRAYNLYRSVHGQERVLVATVGPDVTGFVDTGVEAGVRYLYRVEGVDESGAVVARSRLDGAGCAKRDRDGIERSGERRDERAAERSARKHDADTSDSVGETDAVTVVDPVATAEADAERDDPRTRPVRDDRDRRGRGR